MTRDTTRGGDGQNKPLISPPPNLRSRVVPQEPPNGRWSIPNTRWGTFMLSWYPQAITSITPPTRKHLPYLIYVKNTNLDAQDLGVQESHHS